MNSKNPVSIALLMLCSVIFGTNLVGQEKDLTTTVAAVLLQETEGRGSALVTSYTAMPAGPRVQYTYVYTVQVVNDAGEERTEERSGHVDSKVNELSRMITKSVIFDNKSHKYQTVAGTTVPFADLKNYYNKPIVILPAGKKLTDFQKQIFNENTLVAIQQAAR